MTVSGFQEQMRRRLREQLETSYLLLIVEFILRSTDDMAVNDRGNGV